jgi:type III pantothenate kinase
VPYTIKDVIMLLCIDIGNTNIVFGVVEKDRVVRRWRIRTVKDATADEIGMAVANLFEHSAIKSGDIKDIIITSVVPSLMKAMEEFSIRYFKISPLVAGPGIKTGMTIRYDNPKEVGADRIVNAIAGYEKYHTGLIIIDFGTATTFDCVSKEGEFIGGAIAPGLIISCEALFERASKLPRIETFARPGKVIAKDTASAMNAGIICGYAGLVDGIVNRMKKEFGYEVTVLATGGIAPLIFGESTVINHLEEDLTLEGLMILYKRNR